MAEMMARNALLTSSVEVNTFATSGSSTTTSGPSFRRLAKRLGFAFLGSNAYSADISAALRGLLAGVFFIVFDFIFCCAAGAEKKTVMGSAIVDSVKSCHLCVLITQIRESLAARKVDV